MRESIIDLLLAVAIVSGLTVGALAYFDLLVP